MSKARFVVVISWLALGIAAAPEAHAQEAIAADDAPTPVGDVHIAGAVGAAIGAAVPLAMGVVDTAFRLEWGPRGLPAPMFWLAVMPLPAAVGAFIGLAIDAGLERAWRPAILAGVSAPLGAVGGAVIGSLAGGMAGTCVGLGAFLVHSDRPIEGLQLIAVATGVGLVIGAGVGGTTGALGLPAVVAANGPALRDEWERFVE